MACCNFTELNVYFFVELNCHYRRKENKKVSDHLIGISILLEEPETTQKLPPLNISEVASPLLVISKKKKADDSHLL